MNLLDIFSSEGESSTN